MTNSTINKQKNRSNSKTKPKSKMITGFAYSSHQVADLDRARDFYEGLLGLKSTGSYAGTWEEYDVGGETFAVYKCSQITPPYFKQHKISASLAFEVKDIDKFCVQLKEKGVKFLQEPQNNEEHCKTAFLEDPDGNIITFHQLLE